MKSLFLFASALAVCAVIAPAAVTTAPDSPQAAAARVDTSIRTALGKAAQKPNPPASDEVFVRRLYVQAAGRIPTAAETLSFLEDRTPNKRALLIDRLLASPGYRSQMFNWYADLLRVKDRFDKSGETFVYQQWLKDEIAEDRPWSETVYEMLTAQGRLATVGPAGYLLRDPGMPLDNLSATLSAFLGTNISCAQCHDHPLAPWTQREFYEMAAFFGNIQTYGGKPNALVRQAVKAEPKLRLQGKGIVRKLVLDNMVEIDPVPNKRLTFPTDYKYTDVKPGSPVKPALFAWMNTDKTNPAYAVDITKPAEWQNAFATWMTHPENPRFAANIANRLWKKAFGLAVQEPVTDIDDPSKASNPELLAILSAEMKRVGFDLREFQRLIYTTQAWQAQANVTPDLTAGPYLFAGPLLRRMTAEQAWDSVLTLAVGTEVDRFQLNRAKASEKLVVPGDKVTPKELVAKVEEMKKEAGGGRRGKKKSYQASGQPAQPAKIGGLVIARASELPQPSPESHFLRNFGQSDRKTADDSSLEGGIPQALMLMNGEIEDVVGSPQGLAFKTAAGMHGGPAQIANLYLSFLGRRPTPTETERTLQAAKDGVAFPEIVWAIFNTREFMFVR